MAGVENEGFSQKRFCYEKIFGRFVATIRSLVVCLDFDSFQFREMPVYQNTAPPIALSSGNVGFSFNNEAFPGSATSGTQFALPSYTGLPDGGTSVRWQTVFGTVPTAVSIVRQAAMRILLGVCQEILRGLPSRLCYTGSSMNERGAKLLIVEACLCLWVIAAPIWYLLEFRPLITFFAARLFHKS
jgi:hypothetical protein